MGDAKILTPGEKIKKIRKEFKIKQNEITGGKITRNLISLIENNKAELTNSTANIISSCVNNICKQKDIDFTITPEDLLINNTMQAHKILDDIISEVNSNINNTTYNFSLIIDKAERLVKENPNLDKIPDLYEKLGQSFSNRHDYWQAYVFYLKAYEHLNVQDQRSHLPKVILKLSYCCNNLSKFSESIQIIDTLLSLDIDMSSLLQYKLLLNKALAQKNMNQYMNAIHSLHELENIDLDYDHFFNAQTLEANCYTELKLYKNALDIHFNLYNDKTHYKDLTKQLILLCNIIDTYICINNTKEVQNYLNKAVKILKQPSLEIHKNYSMSIYYDIGNAHIYTGNYDEAIIAFKKTLKDAKENKFYKFEFESLNKLFSIYFKRSDYNQLDDLKLSLMELLLNDNRPEYHNLIYKYINMYSMLNKKDDLDSLVSFALSLNNN